MSLRIKLLLPYFLVLSIVGLVIHFSVLPDLKEREINSNRNHETHYLSLLAASISPDLISMDLAKIHQTLEQIREQRKNWVTITLTNAAGLRLYPLSPEKPPPFKLTNIQKTISYNGQDFGTLSVSIDISPISQAVNSNILDFEMLIFAIFIGGALIGIGVQYLWVARPLKNLSRAAKKLAGGTFEVDFPPSSKDEIGDFILAFQKMRDELHERDQQMKLARKVFENNGEAIVVTDKNNKIIDANPSYINQTGYSKDEVVGKDPNINKSGKHNSKFYQRMWSDILRKGLWSGEIWGKKKNGELYPKHMTITTIRDDSGEIANYIAIARDISDLKKVEIMKAEFISTVSHELRTPLTAMLGSLGLLKKIVTDDLPDDASAMIDVAHRNSVRLINLVNDILDMEKMESGQMEFHMKPMDIGEYLNEALIAYKSYGEDRKIKFELRQYPQAVQIDGDIERLMQAIANLMSNAAKFSPDGGKVELSAEVRNDTVWVSVKDFGLGIPKDFQDKIFEKFTQADSSDVRQKGGTGLGMSITKSIVETHGGSISFETDRNAGTTFYLKLPILTPAPP